MKDIQELMMDMDTNLGRKQAAIDLSSEEKEELVSLINNIDTEGNDADCQCGGTDPASTPCPTSGVCTPQEFCCVVAFPSELTALPDDVNAAVVPKDLTVDADGQCSVQIGNCTVVLDKAKISGCAQIFMSLGIQDAGGNKSYVCCCDCVSLNKKNIICCGLPDENSIAFKLSNLNATLLGDACNNDSKQVWQIKGTLTFTCADHNNGGC